MSKGKKKQTQKLTSLLLAGLLAIIALAFLKPTLYTSSSLLSPQNSNQDHDIPTPLVSTTFNNIKSYSFNENGQLDNKLLSPQMEQLQNEQQRIIKPHFYTYKYTTDDSLATEEVWQITSDKALYDPAFHTSTFNGSVLITATQNATHQTMLELTTPRLTVDHQQKTAYSNQGVSINSPQVQTQSDAINIHLQSRTLALKNQVKSQYVPKP